MTPALWGLKVKVKGKGQGLGLSIDWRNSAFYCHIVICALKVKFHKTIFSSRGTGPVECPLNAARRAAWRGRHQRQRWSSARVGVVTRSVWSRSSIEVHYATLFCPLQIADTMVTCLLPVYFKLLRVRRRKFFLYNSRNNS